MKSLRLLAYDKWYSKNIEKFLNLLDYSPTASILDLGSGDGRFTVEIRKKTGSADITCVEIYEPFINKLKELGFKVVKWDLNKFPYPFEDNSFDVITSNRVIEHLFFPVRFMLEVHRILKPNGYAVISTENLASWDNILALILGYTPFSMEFDNGVYKVGNPLSPHNCEILADSYPPHVRIFTYAGLKELCELIGFHTEKIEGAGHLLGRFGEFIDKRHARFVIIKIKKRG